jgi:hypothetical protein
VTVAEEREKVVHPSWCDPGVCTAPEFRPTYEEYREGRNDRGEHRSSVLAVPGYGPDSDLQVSVSEAVAPWGTGTFLTMQTGDFGLSWTTQIGEGGKGFELFELLAKPIGDLTREFPVLYAERYGYVADATSSGEASAETQDVEDEWETLPGVTDTYPSTSAHDNAQHVEEYDDEELALLEPMPYRLTANGRIVTRGTLQEIRAAVSELVTTRLAAAPERMAPEAHAVNALFNKGYVQRALDESGEWFTVIDGQGPNPQHIQITKE